ncbi:MAG: SDR family NAD(P)-dependent oxidoreductase [Asgard group archaeon]|nr:SDR family NAD(P)-dependent oxidoreductase [Asgard group archaeon]
MTKNILVTGGCGFIGSNIVRKLVSEGYNTLVIDDLSAGRKEYISDCLKKENCTFIKGTITDLPFLEKQMKNIEAVIHEAASPDVRASKDNLYSDLDINVLGTINVLQAMVKNNVSKIIFASSGGTVYGETDVLPTPEDEPFAPISHYGASKAACEHYLSSFSSLYDIEAISLRYGNIFGPPSNHGVMHDFFWKLKRDPTKLEILGNGLQIKSYLYVDDCVDANIQSLLTTINGHQAFNIASTEALIVNEIAQTIIEELGLKDVQLIYTGGERGWEGDVKKSVVDISKAEKKISWKPKIAVRDGIRKYIEWLNEKSKIRK